MPHLIAYDIHSNPLRARLGRKILAYGFDRINKSVYLGNPKSRVYRELKRWLDQQMQQAGPDDSLIILPVTGDQISRMEILGTDQWDRDHLRGDQNTLMF